MGKSVWKVFWDLQCPYSKKHWEHFGSIKDKFKDKYDFEVYLTSLAFHPQAFTAQSGASLVETKKGRPALLKYVDACFVNQDKFMNKVLRDVKTSNIDKIFADIAEEAGVLDTDTGTGTGAEDFTKKVFLAEIHNWENAIKPAYTEHKIALGYGVYGAPKNVINEQLITGTESSWGPSEWTREINRLTHSIEL